MRFRVASPFQSVVRSNQTIRSTPYCAVNPGTTFPYVPKRAGPGLMSTDITRFIGLAGKQIDEEHRVGRAMGPAFAGTAIIVSE